MPKSSNLSFLGIAKETTFGTAVPATAYIPITTTTPKDNLTLLQDKGLRGSMVETYGEVAGTLHSTFDFAGDVFADTTPWVIAGVLGDVATTGASAPYSTVISTLNTGSGQPDSYTLTDYYAVNTRQYAGSKFSEVQLKFSADQFFTYSAKATGLGSVSASKPTQSFGTIPPMAGWIGTCSIGGTSVNTVLDGEIDIKRTATVLNSVNGSQAPYNIWLGPVSVSGKLTVIMEDDSAITSYLAATSTALDFNFTSGTGAALTQIDCHMSQVKYSGADISRGKDYVEVSVSFNAIANSTDVGASGGYSPIKVTVQNAVTSGTYA